jgi:hypothetical protein
VAFYVALTLDGSIFGVMHTPAAPKFELFLWTSSIRSSNFLRTKLNVRTFLRTSSNRTKKKNVLEFIWFLWNFPFFRKKSNFPGGPRAFGNTTREELQRCVSRMLVQFLHIQPGSLVPCSGLMTHSESSCMSGLAMGANDFAFFHGLLPLSHPLVLWAIAIPLGREPASRQAPPSVQYAPS